MFGNSRPQPTSASSAQPDRRAEKVAGASAIRSTAQTHGGAGSTDSTVYLHERILGIWKLGQPVAKGEGTELYLAQPADAAGSPRWDYVLKTIASLRSGPGGIGNSVDSLTHATLKRQIGSAKLQIASTIEASQVKHPNLIAILDASSSGHSPYVVMPRLDGLPMNDAVDALPQFALPVALWWVRQLAQALEAMHAGGWVHGDVKPANILVDSRGHLTLVDLGFARRVHTPMGALFRGTPAYSSPELLNGQTAALPAMDVFALGRVLWEALAQTTPVSPEVMEPVADLIEMMVAPQPADRPTCSVVVKRLLGLEIETLGCHIVPESSRRRAA